MKTNQQLSRSEMKMILGGTRQLPCPDDGPNYHIYCCHFAVFVTVGGILMDEGSDHCDCYITPPAGVSCSLASS